MYGCLNSPLSNKDSEMRIRCVDTHKMNGKVTLSTYFIPSVVSNLYIYIYIRNDRAYSDKQEIDQNVNKLIYFISCLL